MARKPPVLKNTRTKTGARVGRPPHQPTDRTRAQVRAFAGYGLPYRQIATLLGIGVNTLQDHYGADLEAGEAQATAQVARTLYEKATVGKDLGAAIFWMKARAGWSEKAAAVPVDVSGKVSHQHSGEVSVVMTAEQRAAVLAAVRARVMADEPDAGGRGAE